MKQALLVSALILSLALPVVAVENQAFLGVFAETALTKMVGMPEMPDMGEMLEGMDPSMLANIPGMSGMLSMGGPQRILTVRLWSPNLAPQDAFAYITPPEGLKQGKRLDLELYRPKPEEGTSGEGGLPAEADPGNIEGFTIKIYWGSSKTVKPGQPKIIKWEGMSDAEKSRMREESRKAMEKSSYFYKPNWTTGYWPTKKQPGNIAKDASLVGNWALTTNYTGNVAIDVPERVNFLSPIELSSPKLEEAPNLEKALEFRWKQIPHALGMHARIFGMEGRNTMIMWFSSEVLTENFMELNWDYMQMKDVLDLVAAKVMMKGDATAVDVPAGIFKNCDMTMFDMIGYGPGAALDKAQPLPRVQTKTTLRITPLGGKGIGEGMFPGGCDDEE